jgi:hypothetical protein
MLLEAIKKLKFGEKFGGKFRSKKKEGIEPNFGISEEDVRKLAYLIWEKDQSKQAEECWFEAENRIKGCRQ